jgi:hypothetical protein
MRRDAFAVVFAAEADMAQRAVVADGDDSAGVDAVASDSVVHVDDRGDRGGLGAGGVGLLRGYRGSRSKGFTRGISRSASTQVRRGAVADGMRSNASNHSELPR